MINTSARWRLSTFMAIALTVMLYVWLGMARDEWKNAYSFRAKQFDYPNLLVDGFLKGQLSLDAEVHPDLLSTDEAKRRAAPYLLDASLYGGKYYLYFGVVPPLFLLLPYSALTGGDLSLNAATLIYCLLGTGFLLRTYCELRDRFFPSLGPVHNFLALVYLSVGTGIPFLLTRGAVYEFTIAGGFAMVSSCVFFIHRIMSGQTGVGMLAGASLAAGLAVGCRPNLAALLPLLPAAYLFTWKRANVPFRVYSSVAKCTALVLPALLVGIGLATYNTMRFGSPIEFGFRYQLAEMLFRGYPLGKAEFLWPNLEWYYFRPPVLQELFPFSFPINASDRPADYYGWEEVHGNLLPLVGLVALCLLTWARSRRDNEITQRSSTSSASSRVLVHDPAANRAGSPRPWLVGALVLCSTTFLSIGFFASRANRYTVDFHPWMVLTIVLLVGLNAGASVTFSSSKALRAFLGMYLLFLSLVATFGGIQSINQFRNARPKTYAALARILNHPSHWAHLIGIIHYGPLRVGFTLEESSSGKQALVSTGMEPWVDSIHLAVQGSDVKHVTPSFSHGGYGELTGKNFTAKAGETIALDVDMGSLYPPDEHPYWSDENTATRERLRSTLRIVRGTEVLLSTVSGFSISPVGTLRIPGDTDSKDLPAFINVAVVKRLPARSLDDLRHFAWGGVARFRALLHEQTPPDASPLLASGTTGKGNLLSLQIVDPSQARLHLDTWGSGMVSSPHFNFDPAKENVFEVVVVTQVLTADSKDEWKVPPISDPQGKAIHIWINGTPVWTAEIVANRDTYDFIQLGQNWQGFSSAAPVFRGEVHELPIDKSDLDRLLGHIWK
ncbi:MAG: hypothetical protein SFV32_10810 [Opitutaceae bacterium]|nr:hypothetical protein [Opitutaceae bacterium]